MTKKAAKSRRPTSTATLALVEARAVRHALRELQSTLRENAALAKRLVGARARAQQAGVELARTFCDGTDVVVVDRTYIGDLERQRDEAIRQFDHVVAEMQELKKAPVLA